MKFSVRGLAALMLSAVLVPTVAAAQSTAEPEGPPPATDRA